MCYHPLCLSVAVNMKYADLVPFLSPWQRHNFLPWSGITIELWTKGDHPETEESFTNSLSCPHGGHILRWPTYSLWPGVARLNRRSGRLKL